MGFGVGAVARPHLDQTGAMVTLDDPPGRSASGEQKTQIGLGIALSCSPSGGYILLVVGGCLEPDQTAALGSLVGVASEPLSPPGGDTDADKAATGEPD